MTIPTDLIAKLAFEVLLPGDYIAQNVYYLITSFLTEPTTTTFLAGCRAYVEAILAQVDNQMSEDVVIRPMTVDKIEWNDVDDKWETTQNLGSTTPSMTFLNTGDPLPYQNAPVMTAHTNKPTTRGRKFLMGWCDTDADGSILTTTAFQALAAAMQDYVSDWEIIAGQDLVPGVPSTTDGVFRNFLSGSCIDIMYTQRRRVPGVGV